MMCLIRWRSRRLNTDLDELDITDTDEVLNFGTVNRPDVIINCTGITDTR